MSLLETLAARGAVDWRVRTSSDAVAPLGHAQALFSDSTTLDGVGVVRVVVAIADRALAPWATAIAINSSAELLIYEVDGDHRLAIPRHWLSAVLAAKAPKQLRSRSVALAGRKLNAPTLMAEPERILGYLDAFSVGASLSFDGRSVPMLVNEEVVDLCALVPGANADDASRWIEYTTANWPTPPPDVQPAREFISLPLEMPNPWVSHTLRQVTREAYLKGTDIWLNTQLLQAVEGWRKQPHLLTELERDLGLTAEAAGDTVHWR